tara:strand:+ start:20 stop:778 length:759 start_codon:yes stop_codon:yes gene_type:complete
MKKYKLIKVYPGSPKIDFIVTFKTGYDHVSVATSEAGVGCYLHLDNCKTFPENWEEIIEKDYEILSFKENNPGCNKVFKADSQLKDRFCLEDGKKPFYSSEILIDLKLDIYSIKRLSDNVQFKIGDYTNKCKILSINIEGNGLVFNGSYDFGLKDLIKKEKLFCTEDGVDAFKGDEIWFINKSLNFKPQKSINYLADNRVFYFSTKEAAEEYILMTKPCLNITDILNIKVFGSHLNSSWIIAQLKKLVKSKL